MATIKGKRGSDVLNGSARSDFMYGYEGDDKLFAGAGDDNVYGGDGHDELYGQAGRDRLFGEAGNDRLDGGDGDDTLNGGDGDDLVIGGEGSDVLQGGSGNDSLMGNAGNDELGGGPGADTLTGGAGAEIYFYQLASESFGDIITDFEAGIDGLRALNSQNAWDANSVLPGVQLWELVDIAGAAPTNGNGQATVTSDGISTVLQLFNNDGDLQADFSLIINGTVTAEALQLFTYNVAANAFTDPLIIIPGS